MPFHIQLFSFFFKSSAIVFLVAMYDFEDLLGYLTSSDKPLILCIYDNSNRGQMYLCKIQNYLRV